MQETFTGGRKHYFCAENYYTNLCISKQAAGGADTQLGGRALTCIAVQSVQPGTT